MRGGPRAISFLNKERMGEGVVKKTLMARPLVLCYRFWLSFVDSFICSFLALSSSQVLACLSLPFVSASLDKSCWHDCLVVI